ncbi:Dalr Anticodon-Binding Domain-Containing Protein 3 [Manis pentadactyla]|nr:Dalr Anticodon-Binding Domain-Containing Protein 3 [Manis pentadactyla]
MLSCSAFLVASNRLWLQVGAIPRWRASHRPRKGTDTETAGCMQGPEVSTGLRVGPVDGCQAIMDEQKWASRRYGRDAEEGSPGRDRKERPAQLGGQAMLHVPAVDPVTAQPRSRSPPLLSPQP